jgi:DNA-binding CsgD family transcriptional regulator
MDSLRMDRMFASQPRPSRREANSVLLERAKILEPKDRQLIELWLEGNLSVRQIARILELPPGTVSRRMRRLCARLGDPLVAALLDPTCSLPDTYRAIALAHFASCRRIHQLATDSQITRGEVRHILHFVRGWFRALHSPARQPAAPR